MASPDPYRLQRFLTAQGEDYEIALRELQHGKKESHWIWYVFPQVAGLGHSSMARDYAINSRDEGIAYLNHKILGQRLRECAATLLAHQDKQIEDIMGYPDDLKLQSSMTLFATLAPPASIFHQVLNIFYAGKMDARTLNFLETSQRAE
ncbi:MAG: DUF1810 domain-containing protein [Phycisphaerales bacterium]|nr:DUF1810 domain-containing protein [Phycisphaerales bacterium]